MFFVDKQHEDFYNDKIRILQQHGKNDIYYRSLIYTLGICEETRRNFDQIFNINEGINIDSLQSKWQTTTSQKVTRMAFSLFNECMYESEEKMEKGEKSQYYNPSEIFCCSYAPYFYEAIKIRYPEYTKSINYENPKSYEIIKENQDESSNTGIYIRGNDDETIMKQKMLLNQYCKDNDIKHKIIYIDKGFSANDNNRPGLNRMLEDIEKKKINKIIFKDLSRLSRDYMFFLEFEEKCVNKDIEIISLDNDWKKDVEEPILEDIINIIENDEINLSSMS